MPFAFQFASPSSVPLDWRTPYLDPDQDKWGFSKGHGPPSDTVAGDLPKFYQTGKTLFESIMGGEDTYHFDNVSNFPPILFYIAVIIRTKVKDLYDECLPILIKLLAYYTEPLKKDSDQSEDTETLAILKWFSTVRENFSSNPFCSDIDFDVMRSYMLETLTNETRPENWKEVRKDLKCSIGWARRIFRCVMENGRWDKISERKKELMIRELALNKLYKTIRTESNNLESLLNSVFGMRRSSISFNIPKTVPELYKRLLEAYFDNYGVLSNEKVLDQIREKYLAIRDLVREDVLLQYAHRMGDVLSKFSKSCPTSRINKLLEPLRIQLLHETSFVPLDLAPEMYNGNPDYFFRRGIYYSYSPRWRRDAWEALGDTVVDPNHNELLLPIKHKLTEEEERRTTDNSFFDIEKVLKGTGVEVVNVVKYLQYYYFHNIWYWYNCKQLGL